MPSDDGTIMYEADVVEGVAGYLIPLGWTVRHKAKTREQGIDLLMASPRVSLAIEAKGAGSSYEQSKRYGQHFTTGQVRDHVAMAVSTALKVVSAEDHLAAIALPDDAAHRREVAALLPALTAASVTVFWVKLDRSVRVEGAPLPYVELAAGASGADITDITPEPEGGAPGGPDWVPAVTASDFDGMLHLVALTDDVDGWEVTIPSGDATHAAMGPDPFSGGFYPGLDGKPSWFIDTTGGDWTLTVHGREVGIRGTLAGTVPVESLPTHSDAADT